MYGLRINKATYSKLCSMRDKCQNTNWSRPVHISNVADHILTSFLSGKRYSLDIEPWPKEYKFVNVSDDLVEDLRKISVKEGLSLSGLIHRILNNYKEVGDEKVC